MNPVQSRQWQPEGRQEALAEQGDRVFGLPFEGLIQRLTPTDSPVVAAALEDGAAGAAGDAEGPLAGVPRSQAAVARPDLVSLRPAEKPAAGQPIGNGRMGTLVWTSPDAVQLQINRADVFPVNRDHIGERGGATDYCGGIAQVVIGIGSEAFAAGENPFEQRLSLESAECTIKGAGVEVRSFVSAHADVLVMEINDQRRLPEAVRVTVSMVRPPEVVTGDHVATTIFADDRDRIALLQRFRERDYHNASALHVGVVGEVPVKLEEPSTTSRTLVLPAAQGRRVVLITSAATWKTDSDPAAVARALFEQAATQSVNDLREPHRQWWRDFWSRTHVDLSSDDGQAQRAQRWRDLHLYHMASSSRGELPPKWNGSLFVTSGDKRDWGSQYWVWTTEMLYFPLLAADAIELADPFFNM
ncbi:MAG: DUF5703 domain-containing protein, partial [Planctomycetaceae bacterium]